jgi:hypothetical protein
MVLDAKALTWAGKNDIDTAKLKKAKVPIYGKWYFPEIPPNVALVNLETGEQQVFPERMLAGEVIYVPAIDLERAGLVPPDFRVMDVSSASVESTRALRTVAPEPLIAMVRPPGVALATTLAEVDGEQMLIPEDPSELASIHMPSPSIAPFVLAIGFFLVFVGVITNVIFFIVGLLWMLAGAVVWIRVGLLESAAAAAHEHPSESSPPA